MLLSGKRWAVSRLGVPSAGATVATVYRRDPENPDQHQPSDDGEQRDRSLAAIAIVRRCAKASVALMSAGGDEACWARNRSADTAELPASSV